MIQNKLENLKSFTLFDEEVKKAKMELVRKMKHASMANTREYRAVENPSLRNFYFEGFMKDTLKNFSEPSIFTGTLFAIYLDKCLKLTANNGHIEDDGGVYVKYFYKHIPIHLFFSTVEEYEVEENEMFIIDNGIIETAERIVLKNFSLGFKS
jgi:hypothetical protein